MKKAMKLLFSVLALAALLCPAAALAQEGGVSLNGSTSMEKVVGALSEQFMLDHPGVAVTYDATGSGTGIAAARQGTCDIGLASRALTGEESGLIAKTIALDGIAVIVNDACPISDLTVSQIADAFTGRVSNWSELGGADAPIACVGREIGSGTRDGFESVTGTQDACALSQELTSTGAVIQAVASNANAIGYASLSALSAQSGVRALRVGGVPCSEETVLDGSYAIARPFNLVLRADAALSGDAQQFLDFALSDGAAELIRLAGAVPPAGEAAR